MRRCVRAKACGFVSALAPCLQSISTRSPELSVFSPGTPRVRGSISSICEEEAVEEVVEEEAACAPGIFASARAASVAGARPPRSDVRVLAGALRGCAERAGPVDPERSDIDARALVLLPYNARQAFRGRACLTLSTRSTANLK